MSAKISLQSTLIVALSSLLVGNFFCARSADAVKEVLCQLTTTDGSTINCLIDQSALSMSSAEGKHAIDFAEIKAITFSERVDPNVENEALVAVGDLQSDHFETREKAVAQLRGLGRAAARPLKQALTSADAEVARLARRLLAEMGAQDSPELTHDRVQLSNGENLPIHLAFSEVTVRSRRGRFRVPLEAIDKITFSKQNQNLSGPFAAADSSEIVIPPPAAGRTESADAQAWDPNDDVSRDPGALAGWILEVQRNAITMDNVSDANKMSVETKPGDRLEEAYRDRGIVMQATEAASKVEVSAEKLAGFSGGRSATTQRSDLEIKLFAQKTSGDKSESVAGGVLHIGAVVRTQGSGTMGLAAYDSAGRLLAQTLNGATSQLNGGAAVAVGAAGVGWEDQFLGVKSKTPIARIRFFRAGLMKEKNADVAIDDLVFDRISALGLPGGLCRVTALDGDSWVGKAVASEPGCVAIKSEFLGEKSASLTFKLSSIARYEPARRIEIDVSKNTNVPETPRRFGLSHGVLLQSGEAFRARLLSLDEEHAVFGLSGGAALKLPRETLRKVDLIDVPLKPGEQPPPPALLIDEKPGIAFKSKPDGNNPAAPQPADEKKDPANNPAEGIKSMDNVEIVRIDPVSWEITVKDDDGDFTMGMQGLKALVFPLNPKAAQTGSKRAWVLTLREGSRFDADILEITPKEIKANMAGGTVILPAETVETVERK